MESRISEQTAEEAGYWDTRLRAPTCTDDDRAKFAAWRGAKPENRHAFEKIQTIVKTLRENSSRADIRAIRDAARRAAQRKRETSERRKVTAIAAAASVAALAIGAITWIASPQAFRNDPLREFVAMAGKIAEYATAQTYETGTAQRSTITLQDGSTVDLNAQTRIRVAFNAERRKVELLTGQALFNVAKNPRRPFIVRAADRDIIAVGTAFDVRLDATTVRVTLIEGKVRVSGNTSPSAPNVLTAGQQLIAELNPTPTPATTTHSPPSSAAPEPAVIVRTTDIAKVTSWRDGRVSIEDLTLADAVAEMNKYSQLQIRIDDRELTSLRVNGMFRAGEQQAFINALEDYFPIVARHEGDSEIILERRP